jgi:TonB family protein
MITIKRLFLCAILLCCFQSFTYAGLTFSEGVKSYEAGDFASAKLIFERLAELGHRDAQYNLGALYNLGQGVAKDPVKAYGWFYLAGQGGDAQAKKISDLLYKKLPPAQQIEAIKFRDSLIGGYGAAALNASLLPELTKSDMGYCKIEPILKKLPVYPSIMARAGGQGWVDIEHTISKEGYVKDIFVLESVPKDAFVPAAVRAMRHWRFAPPLVDGRNENVYGKQTRIIFKMEGDPPASYMKKLNDDIAPFLQKAKEGDPYYQYLYAYVMTMHPDLGMALDERNEWYLKSAQGGFAPAQYSLANSLLYGQGCMPDNAKAMEWFTKAAQSDYAPAQVLLGRLLLKLPGQAQREKGVFWFQKAADNKFVPASMALAWVQATSSDQNLRNPVQALKLARPVYKDYADRVTALETMAAAYAAAGDFKQAVKFQKNAIKEATEQEWNLQQLQQRLDAYTNGKAWFES